MYAVCSKMPAFQYLVQSCARTWHVQCHLRQLIQVAISEISATSPSGGPVSTCSSTSYMVHLQHGIDELIEAAIAPNTRLAYERAIASLTEFCENTWFANDIADTSKVPLTLYRGLLQSEKSRRLQ